MTRPELFQKLGVILDTAERDRTYGTVEFVLQDGRITLLRTVKTEKIEDKGSPAHATRTFR